MVYIPTEAEEQKDLFRWAELMQKKYPELELMFHVPNGGKRSVTEARRFQAEGVKAGVPDICLPVARFGFHGLWIELKRRKGGRVSDPQRRWINALSEQGYLAVVCNGYGEAVAVIEQYLRR